MSRRLALLVLLSACALPFSARAQEADASTPDDGGAVIDAPDGSVGEGGADRDNPEGSDSTGRVPTVCHQSADCAPSFRCVQGHCAYVGIRDAEGGLGCGCSSASGAPLLLWVGAALLSLHSKSKFRGIR